MAIDASSARHLLQHRLHRYTGFVVCKRLEAREDFASYDFFAGTRDQPVIDKERSALIEQSAGAYLGFPKRRFKLPPVSLVCLFDISTVVQQVGGLIIEYMRAKAIQEVVTTTHQPVLAVVEQVRRDFDLKADHWSLGYAVTIEGLKSAADIAARSPGAAAQAAVIGQARVLADQNKKRFDALATEIAASVSSLREAQINLRHAVQSRDITIEEIQTYAARIEELVKVYKILRAP